MKLTESIITNAQPKYKTYKLADGNGLYLEVFPTGAKYWRFRFRFNGKDKRIALGVYPLIPLASARVKGNEAKTQVSQQIDPTCVRKASKVNAQQQKVATVETIARAWHHTRKEAWTEKHADYVLRRLAVYVFPTLGNTPIHHVTRQNLRTLIQTIEHQGSSITARRIAQSLHQIFDYALDTERVDSNPATGLVRILKVAKKTQHHAALSVNEIPAFVQTLTHAELPEHTRLALMLLMLTFVRSNELRGARWSEIDWDAAEWRIPKTRMKNGNSHIVPLSTHALTLLTTLNTMNQTHSAFVFPSPTDPNTPMSDNTLLYALYALGYKGTLTVHGFRTTASTALNEAGYRADVIEKQLAHCARDTVRSAYNRAEYKPERKKMMQDWSNHVLEGTPFGFV